MNAASPVPCKLLPWDTEFFGCRLGRVCGDTLRPELAARIDDWSRSNQIHGLYFLARVDDPATIQTAEQNGFGLVDIRVTLARKLVDSDAPAAASLPAGFRIRPVQPDDLPRLQAMARTGHGDTRFFSDGHFSRQRVEDFYSTWITLESEGRAQSVFVAAGGRQPLGYVSCHLDSGGRDGQIGLVGVAPEARGQGIGAGLVQTAVDWFRTQGAREVTVVTQGRNLAAQRLYQKCGFLSRNLELWYHKWYPIQA
jgi:dTDP-4-amino-4,6-dideoxy-D-galactose acyltransferase